MGLLRNDIEAGLDLLPHIPKTNAARVLLYATSRQENPERHPRQLVKNPVTGALEPKGPAAGDFQFELGDSISRAGVWGVLNHFRVGSVARAVARARGVEHTPSAVFRQIQTDPVLAAALARLLYYSTPNALPAIGDEAGAWALYTSTWRPGALVRQPAELRAKWSKSYADAMTAYDLA